jgi:hypothetical protein
VTLHPSTLPRHALTHCLLPRFIMLLVEFEPTFLTARYRHAVLPCDISAGFVERSLIIQRFELERFLDGKSKKNTMTVFVNSISFRELVERETHVTPIPLRKMSETDGVWKRPTVPIAKLKLWPINVGSGHLCATIDDSVLSQQGNETRGLT